MLFLVNLQRDYSFAHLLLAHSEKPSPHSPSCLSVFTWRTEDVLLGSELSQGLLLTSPFF